MNKEYLVTIEENGEAADPVLMTLAELVLELIDRDADLSIAFWKRKRGRVTIGNTIVYYQLLMPSRP